MSDPAPASFEELVQRHRGDVQRVCRSILRDEHLGADAAQETFLRLWRRTAGGDAPSACGAWLRKAAVGAALDLARRRAARGTDALDEDDEPASADATRIPLEAAELRERFEAALATLSDGQRTVFLLRHEGGLSLADVAETLELALPTVKTQFARACVKLQERLAPFDPAREEKP